MSRSEILAAIEELHTSIYSLQTSIDTNLQAINPSPPPPRSFPPILPTTHSTSLLPIRRFSPFEIEEKNDCGLCYNCDQTWSNTHRCRSKFLIMFGTDDENDFGDPKSPYLHPPPPPTWIDLHPPPPPTRIDPTFSPCISHSLFTGLKSPSLLPLIVPQSSPPPSPAIPPPTPITPLASPLSILGSRFWLLVGSEDEIVVVAFGSISVAIADVLTVGVPSSFYPSMIVFAGQEVQLCGEPPPGLLGIPSPFVSVLEFAWIIAWINFVQATVYAVVDLPFSHIGAQLHSSLSSSSLRSSSGCGAHRGDAAVTGTQCSSSSGSAADRGRCSSSGGSATDRARRSSSDGCAADKGVMQQQP